MLYTVTSLAGYPIQILHFFMLSVYRKEFSLYIMFVVAGFTWRINPIMRQAHGSVSKMTLPSLLIIGSYSGCGYTYQRDTLKTFSLDPLSNKTLSSWDARTLPTIKWSSRPIEDSTRYTLVILDVASGTVNALYHDIDGTEVSSNALTDSYTVVCPYFLTCFPRI